MRVKVAGGLALGVVAVLLLAFAVDRARGVTQGSIDGATSVVASAPGGALRTTAGALGLRVDPVATRRARRAAESSKQPLDWVRGLFGARSAPVVATIDFEKVAAVVRAQDPTTRTEPVEPSVVGTGEGIVVRGGKAGRGLDTAALATAVRRAARYPGRRIEADVAPVRLAPLHTRREAEALADRARRLTAEGLTVTADGARATISASRLRSWVRSTDDLQLDLDGGEVRRDLASVLDEVGRPAQDATVRIEGGRPVVVAAVTGRRCCDDGAAAAIRDAVVAGRSTVEVPLMVTQPSRTTDGARDLKITEVVGTFTTRYPPGQPRVTNIHRIADLVDGAVIGPGGRFSVNTTVGPRTPEKGFVVDRAIADGKYITTVGGGISQFATTLFNAAFFAGLDIPSYQSHSIYISRYPYGREATLSWPKPDLVVSNTTPYGVLVDTSYTATTITVTLWSTRYATGEQTNQTTSPVGQCTRVKTERTRRYVDGRTKVDYVYATYRPSEGVQC